MEKLLLIAAIGLMLVLMAIVASGLMIATGFCELASGAMKASGSMLRFGMTER